MQIAKPESVRNITDVIAYLELLQVERPSRLVKTTKGEKTKTRILEACYLVFFEHGHKGMSFAKIGEKTGMTKGNITYHYKSKADLLADMYEEVLGIFAVRLLQILRASENDPKRALMDILHLIIKDSLTRYPFYMQTYGYVISQQDTGVGISNSYNKYWRVISHLLQLLNPTASDAKVQELTLFVRSMAHGLNILNGMSAGNEQALRALQESMNVRIWNTIELELLASS
ncbi:MAG: hypothetical protein COA91_08945 [Robiginitomaculum sp.]|nr:MAG: hypothetical protein COA91_08945 [Robiginitomaculum sp.]